MNTEQAIELAIELLQDEELYRNPVMELHEDECLALLSALSNAAIDKTLTQEQASNVMAAIFKTALGLAYKAGRESMDKLVKATERLHAHSLCNEFSSDTSEFVDAVTFAYADMFGLERPDWDELIDKDE